MGYGLLLMGYSQQAVTYHVQMSTAKQIMDADDMRDADWAILEVLVDGRANAPLIAEETGYSAQYIRERLGRLKQDDIVIPVGHGIYELNGDEIPGHSNS
jgi:hypothetical protein